MLTEDVSSHSQTMNDSRTHFPHEESSTYGARRLGFGPYELDLRERELRKHGIRIKLQKKPLQILELLLQTPGAFVTRAQLAQHLWPGMHVSFNGSLNTAVNSLRQALGDSPRNPRFIETQPGRGYRFIASVVLVGETNDALHEQGPIDSIAVLPFENVAGDAALDYISDGITESLITSLSTLERVRVIARSTAFRFRGHDIEPRSAGKRLNVRAVLTGRVVQRETAFTISAELVDVRLGWRLWGNDFSCSPADVLGVEKDICTEVCKRLGLHTTGDAGNRLSKTRTGNFAAYQDYLKGRHFYNKLTEEDLRKSVAYFDAALRQDPRYALAYTGLADAYSLFAFLGMVPAKEAHALSEKFTTSALSIDSELAEAHASLASVKHLYDWDWEGAEAEYLRALDLNPSYAGGHHRYANLLSAAGRSEEAMEQMRLAQELDPLSPVIDMEMAWNRYMARDFQGAEEQSWKALAVEPRFAAAQHTLGLAYEQMGMIEEAMVELQNARTCSGGRPSTLAALGHAYATAGRTSEARELLCELQQMSQHRYVSPYWCGILYRGLGEDDLALESLEKAYQERDLWLIWLGVEPRFDGLRSNARFEELLRNIRLPLPRT
jgi:TolB-like protein/tetratricopeptide (TPR) repeat protein